MNDYIKGFVINGQIDYTLDNSLVVETIEIHNQDELHSALFGETAQVMIRKYNMQPITAYASLYLDVDGEMKKSVNKVGINATFLTNFDPFEFK